MYLMPFAVSSLRSNIDVPGRVYYNDNFFWLMTPGRLKLRLKFEVIVNIIYRLFSPVLVTLNKKKPFIYSLEKII